MKTLIGIPCMDMVNAMFMRSVLGMELEGTVEYSLAIGSLVYDARNQLAQRAVVNGFDAVLWLDSDMTFGPDLFKRMAARLDEGAEFVSALAFTRKPPTHPVVYDYIGLDENRTPRAIPIMEYPENEIFEINGAGLGCVMMTTDLIDRVGRKFGLPFSPVMGFGEDLSFCMHVKELGVPMFCDSGIKAGHLAYVEVNEELYKKGGLTWTK